VNDVTLRTLESFPQRLEQHFAAIPAGFENWAPSSWEGVPSEPFTAIEQICHVRDIEVDGYLVRFRRTLEENDPVLPALDGETLARQRRYAASDALEVLAAFQAARARTLALIAALRPEQLARTATFEGYGRVSLASLIHYLCSHDQQHLAGLQWLLGKIEASRPGRGGS
jgi:hypothetical protein